MREPWPVHVHFHTVHNKIYKANGLDEKFCLRKYKTEHNHPTILLKILLFLMSLI